MSNNSSPVSDTLVIVSVVSTLLLTCASFALVLQLKTQKLFGDVYNVAKHLLTNVH